MSQANWPGASGSSVVVDDGVVTASGGFVGAVTGSTAGTHTGAVVGNADTATLATAASGQAAGAPFYVAAAQAAIDMAGAGHALVLGTATAGQTQLVGNTVLIDANATGGGTSEQILKLPPITDFPAGKTLRIRLINRGGEDIPLHKAAAGGATGTTLAAGQTKEMEYVTAYSTWVSTMSGA